MNYKDLFNFENTHATIIGGASGLGLVCTKALLAHNCKVTIGSREMGSLKSVQKELESIYPNNLSHKEVNVTEETSVKNFFDYISSKNNSMTNIVVFSAGINIRNPIQEISSKEFVSIIETNLVGGFLAAKYALPLLKRAEFGRFIALSSIFASSSYAHRTSYASSKGGLSSLTKTLAVEWANTNITANTISPGPCLTEINKKVLDDPQNYQKFCSRIPMQRFGNPEELATSFLFLASRYSSYCTGADIIVDGGWLAS